MNCWKKTSPNPMISRRHMFDVGFVPELDECVLEFLSFKYDVFWFVIELSLKTSLQNARHGIQPLLFPIYKTEIKIM